MGRVSGKVAFVTGVVRGQGRSHALLLAEEGADIIAVDICQQTEFANYPAGCRPAGRRVPGNRRGRPGRCDQHHLGDAAESQRRGSITATGSVAALVVGHADSPTNGPGGAGYAHAKRAIVPLVRDLALAPEVIRGNAVHPTNCDTGMLQSEPMYRLFRPDLEAPTREDAEPAFASLQAMRNVPRISPREIRNAVLFLASDESRYVTGLQLKVDAGATLKQSSL